MPDPSPNLKPVLDFLDELHRNNNKPWFDEHRPAYQAARLANPAKYHGHYSLLNPVTGENPDAPPASSGSPASGIRGTLDGALSGTA